MLTSDAAAHTVEMETAREIGLSGVSSTLSPARGAHSRTTSDMIPTGFDTLMFE